MATEQGMFCFRLPREALDAMREMARARHMTTAAWLREQVRDGLYLGNPARVALGAEGLDAAALDRPPDARQYFPRREQWFVCRQCEGFKCVTSWDPSDGACWWAEGNLCSQCKEGDAA